MKKNLHIVIKKSNGRLWDLRRKCWTTPKRVLELHQTLNEDAVRVVNKRGEDITETILVNAAIKHCSKDPVFRERVLEFLDQTEAV